MNPRRYIVDILRQLVANVQTNLIAQLSAYSSDIQGVHYLFGHPLEINERLQQMEESGTFSFKKYPLVAYFTDTDETKGVLGEYSHARLHIAVINQTSPTFRAEDRLEKNFKPIIHPVVDELISQITSSPYFLDFDPDLTDRVETDRYFWGRGGAYGNTAIIGNDYWDATELQLNVRVSPNCILNPNSSNLKK